MVAIFFITIWRASYSQGYLKGGFFVVAILPSGMACMEVSYCIYLRIFHSLAVEAILLHASWLTGMILTHACILHIIAQWIGDDNVSRSQRTDRTKSRGKYFTFIHDEHYDHLPFSFPWVGCTSGFLLVSPPSSFVWPHIVRPKLSCSKHGNENLHRLCQIWTYATGMVRPHFRHFASADIYRR